MGMRDTALEREQALQQAIQEALRDARQDGEDCVVFACNPPCDGLTWETCQMCERVIVTPDGLICRERKH